MAQRRNAILKTAILLFAAWLFGSEGRCLGQTKIDFITQIKPIFADKCLHCHGPDTENQDSDFRMDSRDHLFEDLGGYFAIVPGDQKKSELWKRIHSEDDPMPPEDSNRTLTAEEKRLIDQWIQQGAHYSEHWAFELPKKQPIPKQFALQNAKKNKWNEALVNSWTKNPIDIFVARKLIQQNLKPSGRASYPTLFRRVSLTSTGLLPSKTDIEEARTESQSAGKEKRYLSFVENRLTSMDYAERQSLLWLDAARYADTDGYQNDQERTNWPWRDWVTKAFYENMPFDQFTIEQLAGDMLPKPTKMQILATAFNRNHRQNNEGGALAEEFFVENVMDRVETTSTVWLGLTMGCSRCHDHKFDPISQKEFYQFYGYFNNIGDKGKARGIHATPTIKSYSPLKDFQAKDDGTPKQRVPAVTKKPAVVMVMKERDGKPTETYFLNRGQYDQADKSEKLKRGIPKALFGQGKKQPTNRLELATWLVSDKNPLTARVIVNRIWQQHFGKGLVDTPEDFGVQGTPPSHPDLLDWLAVEFMESGWDVRAMHRLILTSETYKQSSKATKVGLENDPMNRFLGRGPRFRADGFTIRDIALQASGRLVDLPGGPPVKPYQPKGLWESVAANKGSTYKPSSGDSLYRKSMYTYWKRAVNPPRQTIFDAGGREVCNVSSKRTNTPLQALVLMNDPTFVEAAARLAIQVSRERPKETPAGKIKRIYQVAIGKSASKKTLEILLNSQRFYLEHFQKNSSDATELISSSRQFQAKEFKDQNEMASFIAIAHIVLNLDEFVTIE